MLVNEWLGVLGLLGEAYILTGILCVRSVINPDFLLKVPTSGPFLYPARTSEAFISGTALIFCSHRQCLLERAPESTSCVFLGHYDVT